MHADQLAGWVTVIADARRDIVRALDPTYADRAAALLAHANDTLAEIQMEITTASQEDG